MNFQYLKKSEGCRVQLVPIACRLDEDNRELPEEDDRWIIERVTDDGVHIRNIRTSQGLTLGLDHIHHFTSNPDRSRDGIKHGFLTLHVQVFLLVRGFRLRPNARPGEPVKPETPRIVEKLVDFTYPGDSGILRKIESEGWRAAWCLETNLARKIDLEGWRIVVEPDGQGVLSQFRVKDRPADQILIKKKFLIHM